jgi:dihydrofolate reductase
LEATVGQLIVQQFVSADGFAADADNEFTVFRGETMPSDEIDNETLARLETVDAIVLGANTYRMFADYWPLPASNDEILAPRINELPKIVFSRRLDAAPWGDFDPAMVISEEATDAIQRLKEDLDGDLIVWGSLTLTEELFDADLVDIVRLVIVPTVLGAGRSVFPPTFAGTRLRVLRTGTFDEGLVAIEYGIDRGDS